MKAERDFESDAAIAFVRQSVRLWVVIALVCVFVGNCIGWFWARCSSNLLGVLALSSGFFAFSVLSSAGFSRMLWEQRNSKPILLGFAIPMAAGAPISIGGWILFGRHYIKTLVDQMCGLSFSSGLMFLGGISWGVVVGIRRRRAFRQLGTK